MAKLIRIAAALFLAGILTAAVGAGAIWFLLVPDLPSIEILKDVKLQVPLRVYTSDGKLVAEFGEKRRTPLRMAEIPKPLVQAVLAAEEERFYEHPGVDWQGITRAVLHLIRTGEKGPGGSTITMQVARNFFLGREKTYLRKMNEILLALKIERSISKDEILELYFNTIFLGHRACGVGAAAQVYYGRSVGELTLPQIAMIAGLPKAPSRFNPIADPERALSRRNYVLGRMRELAFITAQQHQSALDSPVSARLHGLAVELDAPYVAEMARNFMEERWGDDAYIAGFSAYLTVDSHLQGVAREALQATLVDYDERHGYRGAELQVDPVEEESERARIVNDIPVIGGLDPALVVAVAEDGITVHSRTFGSLSIPHAGLAWARPYIDENRRGATPKVPADVAKVGDVVRLRHTEDGWRLTQVPAVEGALVAMRPDNGALVALVGGVDFYRSKFNRAVQARRQPGSSFKPFIYSAALENGFTPATLINDAPVVFDDPSLEGRWRPENYSGKFFGPTRLRMALTKSRNLVSIRLLRSMGVDYAIEYAGRFGLDVTRLPRNLSLALGSGALTPLELATGYSVFANGGYQVKPFFVQRVVGTDGEVVFEADPLSVCRQCERDAAVKSASNGDAASALVPVVAEVVAAGESMPPSEAPILAEPPATARPAPRVMEARNAWLMNSMMRDVIRRGTG
ncbi:MAG: peptidase, partial [Gammaproteobacteria bacterium]